MAGPGRPKTGGRRKGVKNVVTREKERLIKALCPPGDDPLTFWVHVLKDKNAPYEVRASAARDLAPYVHPKLASIEARTGGKTHEQRLAELQSMIEDEGE